ncbi:MAG: hypothetical protein AB1774_04550 [Bacillota bacterium]
MTWVYRGIALIVAVGTVDYILRQERLTRQIVGAMVLIPLLLRILLFR